MVLIDWYKQVVLKNYANFSGRASKSEFWYFVLANFIISFVLSLIDKAIGIQILSGLYSLAVLVPGLAVSVRRLHDIGKSGWALLIALIPFVGAIILIVWDVQAGQPDANSYGEVPKDTPDEASANVE